MASPPSPRPLPSLPPLPLPSGRRRRWKLRETARFGPGSRRPQPSGTTAKSSGLTAHPDRRRLPRRDDGRSSHQKRAEWPSSLPALAVILKPRWTPEGTPGVHPLILRHIPAVAALRPPSGDWAPPGCSALTGPARASRRFRFDKGHARRSHARGRSSPVAQLPSSPHWGWRCSSLRRSTPARSLLTPALAPPLGEVLHAPPEGAGRPREGAALAPPLGEVLHGMHVSAASSGPGGARSVASLRRMEQTDPHLPGSVRPLHRREHRGQPRPLARPTRAFDATGPLRLCTGCNAAEGGALG